MSRMDLWTRFGELSCHHPRVLGLTSFVWVKRIAVLEQLHQLKGPPSVQMQDVPRESIGEHLGFGFTEGERGRDELDGQLARQYEYIICIFPVSYTLIEHARYLYDLQESESTADSEESESSDSDASSSTANHWRRTPYRSSSVSRINKPHNLYPHTSAMDRKRMSIITGKYYEIPIQENGFGHYDYNTMPFKASTKRKFFQHTAWDDLGIIIDGSIDARKEVMNGYTRGSSAPYYDLAGVMEQGGTGVLDSGYGEDELGEELDEDEEDVDMSVDS